MKYLFILFFLMVNFISFSQIGYNEAIRGTWITNVGSKVLLSKENIIEGVKKCKEAGLNHIFVVVWNNGVTMYPSKVVEKYIGIKQDKKYKGFDPIQCIVDEGHKQGLKVHAWFEFGFSYSYNDSNSIWRKKYPHWCGRKIDGSLLQKNKFYWWNSLHQEVQLFMTELVLEVVKKYKVDGIQGDDRLPAMPSEGGYDAYTMGLHEKQNRGKKVPNNPKDKAFVQWKANQLSVYAKELYKQVKKVRKNCMVTWAPSIYPWSKEEYLQDWPKWLNGGYADYILPQLYRYHITGYEKIVKELDAQLTKEQKAKVFPGILTSLGGGYQSSKSLTDSMILLNRQYGFEGEVFFYYETLNRLPEGIYRNNIDIPVPVNVETQIDETTQQKIRDAIKELNGISVQFEGGKAIFSGKTNKGNRLKLVQICIAAHIVPDLSNLMEE